MLLVTLLLAPAAAYVVPGAGVSGEGSPKLGVPCVEVLTYINTTTNSKEYRL